MRSAARWLTTQWWVALDRRQWRRVAAPRDTMKRRMVTPHAQRRSSRCIRCTECSSPRPVMRCLPRTTRVWEHTPPVRCTRDPSPRVCAGSMCAAVRTTGESRSSTKRRHCAHTGAQSVSSFMADTYDRTATSRSPRSLAIRLLSGGRLYFWQFGQVPRRLQHQQHPAQGGALAPAPRWRRCASGRTGSSCTPPGPARRAPRRAPGAPTRHRRRAPPTTQSRPPPAKGLWKREHCGTGAGGTAGSPRAAPAAPEARGLRREALLQRHRATRQARQPARQAAALPA